MSKKYPVEHFIEKFTAIPDELWCVGDYTEGNKCCALGHCGSKQDGDDVMTTPESEALSLLFINTVTPCVDLINDGDYGRYPQPTPRLRILAALEDVKKGKTR